MVKWCLYFRHKRILPIMNFRMSYWYKQQTYNNKVWMLEFIFWTFEGLFNRTIKQIVNEGSWTAPLASFTSKRPATKGVSPISWHRGELFRLNGGVFLQRIERPESMFWVCNWTSGSMALGECETFFSCFDQIYTIEIFILDFYQGF